MTARWWEGAPELSPLQSCRGLPPCAEYEKQTQLTKGRNRPTNAGNKLVVVGCRGEGKCGGRGVGGGVTWGGEGEGRERREAQSRAESGVHSCPDDTREATVTPYGLRVRRTPPK